MNGRDINIALVVVVVMLLALMALRVSYEPHPGAGGCCSKSGGCEAAFENQSQRR